MTPVTRSTSGALLMLAIIPFIVGLLACMPVPIGDPERSRIDPDISGVWVVNDDDDSVLYHFRPYDKRTWLLMGVWPEKGPEFEGAEFNVESARDLLHALETRSIGDKGMTSTTTVAYKVWLTKLGGVQFMTWELVGGFNKDGSTTPEFWWVFKVVKTDRDHFELHLVDSESAAFEHIVSPDDYEGGDYVGDMRRTWERALKKAADDEDIYDDSWEFQRIPDSLVGQASTLFREVIGFLE